jgi:hypothetical protein
MPLSSLDIVFYYSAGATGPANNTLSLGSSIGAASATIPDATANNIFDDVTGDESASGDTEYRGIYFKDTNATYTMINPRIWITGFVRSGANYDTISIAGSTFALNGNTMGVCANESSAPGETGLTWVVEGSPSNTIGFDTSGLPTTVSANWVNKTLSAGNYYGLWLKREVPVGAAAYTNRSATIRVQCETTASPLIKIVTTDIVVNWTKNQFYAFAKRI